MMSVYARDSIAVRRLRWYSLRAARACAQGLLLVFTLSACEALDVLEQAGIASRPEAQVENLRVVGFSPTGVTIEVDLGVDNPNPITISAAAVGYSLTVGSRNLVTGYREEVTRLASNGHSTLTIPLTFEFSELRALAAEFADRTEIDYGLELEVFLDLPGLRGIPLKTSRTGTLPIPRPPEIKVTGFRVDRLGLLNADLNLQLEVDNPNAFALIPRELEYAVTVNGSVWASGALRELPSVDGGMTQQLEIPVSLKLSEVGSGVFRMLAGRGEGLGVAIEGHLLLDTSLPHLSNVRLPLHVAGEIGR